MKRLLLALTLAACLAPAAARAETCTFADDGDWGPEGTWTGTAFADCTPDATDSFVCSGGHTIQVVDDVTVVDIDYGDCTVNIESDQKTGGEGPIVIQLTGDGGGAAGRAMDSSSADATFYARGRVLSFGVGVSHPTYTEDPSTTPGSYATLGRILPCGALACASAQGTTRIVYDADKFDQADGEEWDLDWPGYLAQLTAGADSTAGGHTIQLFSPGGADDGSPPMSAGQTFLVTAVDATCTGASDCYFEIDTTQDDGGNEAGYTGARRQWITGTLAADINRGDKCATIPADTFQDTADAGTDHDPDYYNGHALYLERGGDIDDTMPFIINRGIEGGAGTDQVCIARAEGFPQDYDSSSADEQTFWIGPHALRPGDPFFARAAIFVTGDAGTTNDGGLTLRGTFDAKGIVFARQKFTQIGDNANTVNSRVVNAESIWTLRQLDASGHSIEFYNLGNGADSKTWDSEMTLKWFTNTTGGEAASADIHCIDADNVNSVTVTDSSLYYCSDDIFFLEDVLTDARIERIVIGPTASPSTSGNLLDLDNQTTSMNVVLRDIVCRTCGSRDDSFSLIAAGYGAAQGDVRVYDLVIDGLHLMDPGTSSQNTGSVLYPEFYRLTAVGFTATTNGSGAIPQRLYDSTIRDCSLNGGLLSGQGQEIRRVLIDGCDSGDVNNASEPVIQLASTDSQGSASVYEDILVYRHKCTGSTGCWIIFDSNTGSAGNTLRRVAVGNPFGFASSGVEGFYQKTAIGLTTAEGIGFFGLRSNAVQGAAAGVAFDGRDASSMNNAARWDFNGPVCFWDNEDSAGAEAHLPSDQFAGLPDGTPHALNVSMDQAPPLLYPNAPRSLAVAGRAGIWHSIGSTSHPVRSCFPRTAGVTKTSWALRASGLEPEFVDFTTLGSTADDQCPAPGCPKP